VETLRVVVVDAFPLTRAAVREVLQTRGFPVVAEAGCAADGLRAVRAARPGAVIIEPWLPGDAGGGVELCRLLKRMPAPPRVVMFAQDNDPGLIAACVVAGADGFVHKSAEPHLLLDAVDQVLRSKRPWVLGRAGAPRPDLAPEAPRPASCMTGREREVLDLLLRRLTNEEIAAELGVAGQTVKNHVSSVLQKLCVSSRKHLLRTYQTPVATRPEAVRRGRPAQRGVRRPAASPVESRGTRP
jgi:DNA-binding NarL/FixJ family response regulator